MGLPMDFGLVDQPIAETDDYGNLASPVTIVIDLGGLSA